MHLSFDELYQLAQASVNQEGFDDLQIEQLEHLKTCRECYESFCLLSALSDVMSESESYRLFSENAAVLESNLVRTVKSVVLAKLQVIRSAAEKSFGAVLEQLDQAAASLKFGPSLAVATRGAASGDSKVIRLEEFEDDKTYIVFNPETNEVKIQISVRGRDIESLHIYLVFDNDARIELPVTKRGSIIKGAMEDIPSGDFQIVIEAE